MYCQLHRPVTSGSQVACFLGHVGDRIYWIQKGFWLPDALGLVPPPYFPMFHVGITALVSFMLVKTMFYDPLATLFSFSSIRRRNKMNKCNGPAAFLKLCLSNTLLVVFEMFILSSIINIVFLIIFQNTGLSSNGNENPELYSQVMRNKLTKYGIIF